MLVKDTSQRAPYYARRIYRWLSGVFGTFLVGVGLYALVFTEGPWSALRLAGGLGLLVVGGNMIIAASAAKESWLSKIGPLP